MPCSCSHQASIIDVYDSDVSVRYIGDWANTEDVVRVPMANVRLPPAELSQTAQQAEFVTGTELEVYDTLLNAHGPAYWRATLKVRLGYGSNH